ncbi:rhamnogalacturonan lyase [Clostridium cibarium]|uniref:Rhamnogalacturonan lyase n=1 Tax=Clostridium cibarium TaxID=2762247 RepID=A0ABR8PWC4_9CLOT|nr:rhamnogalacturonan lyase [Clostridium cibarium]MBD7912444.1 rhamnogalacturonan lyase [Clostridium cibarium]
MLDNFSQKSYVYAASARQMEGLDRGVIATKTSNGVYIGWRMFGTDSSKISFNVYRNGNKITSSPITSSTNYIDKGGNISSKYYIRPVINGVEEVASKTVSVSQNPYLNVPIQKPADGITPKGEKYTYSANDGSVGDVDGDGEYEIILKWDPSNSKDNSQSGYTGNVYLDAYKLNGTRLWRIDLGKNIRAGAHYTQFMVYDFDGDGKAEVACRTADGTKDGVGKYIGDSSKDYRNSSGYILSGPEYLTMFEGKTGKNLSTISFSPERGLVKDWGDTYGNRVDRFLGGVAYLDGVTPSLIMGRGYYEKSAITAYDFKNGKLTKRWNFTADGSQNSNYKGRGCHSLSIADVDKDGKDEVVYGAATIDDNGKGLYTTKFSHGDALHVGDLDPTRDGLEVFQVHESKSGPNATLRDAKTGNVLTSLKVGDIDCGRGLTADIDPRYPGEEMWAIGGVGLYSIKGQKISNSTPSINFAAWWDGDLSRELVDSNRIDKWDYNNNRTRNILTANGCSSNNTTKATPVLQADILGDWREEIIWKTDDSSALRIYSTTDVTNYRIYTLMHDSQYREAIASQNSAYNQPPHPSFFIGTDMKSVPTPNIYLTKSLKAHQ